MHQIEALVTRQFFKFPQMVHTFFRMRHFQGICRIMAHSIYKLTILASQLYQLESALSLPKKRGGVTYWLGRWTCDPEVPGSSPPLCLQQKYLFSARFVNSQLVCLLPVGIFNLLCLIWIICFRFECSAPLAYCYIAIKNVIMFST